MRGRNNKHAVAIPALPIAAAAAPPDQHRSERSTRSRASWLSNVRHKRLAVVPALAAPARRDVPARFGPNPLRRHTQPGPDRLVHGHHGAVDHQVLRLRRHIPRRRLRRPSRNINHPVRLESCCSRSRWRPPA